MWADLLLAVFLFHVHGHSAASFDRSPVMVGLGLSWREANRSISWKKIVGWASYLAYPCWSVQRLLLSGFAFWAVLFFRGNWKAFGKILYGDRGLWRDLSLQDWIRRSIIKQLCRSWNKKGWLRTALVYQSGLDRYGAQPRRYERRLASLYWWG